MMLKYVSKVSLLNDIFIPNKDFPRPNIKPCFIGVGLFEWFEMYWTFLDDTCSYMESVGLSNIESIFCLY